MSNHWRSRRCESMSPGWRLYRAAMLIGGIAVWSYLLGPGILDLMERIGQ